MNKDISSLFSLEDMTMTTTTEQIELVDKALQRAWSLGQVYWMQADSESYSENKKSDTTLERFKAHVAETRAALSSPQVAEPAGCEPWQIDRWQQVPLKITEAMHAAAVRTIVRCGGNDDFPPRVWNAMLDAAPAHPPKPEPLPAQPERAALGIPECGGPLCDARDHHPLCAKDTATSAQPERAGAVLGASQTEKVVADLLSALGAMLTQFGMDEDDDSKPTFNQARQAYDYARIVMRPMEPHERHALAAKRQLTRGWHERAVAIGADGVADILHAAEVAKRRGELQTVDGFVSRWTFQPVPAVESLYVECRECDECDHRGINDSSDDLAACHHCDWSGPPPVEDKCPGCGQENCMTAACPECGGRYRLIADAKVPLPTPAPLAQLAEVAVTELRRIERELTNYNPAGDEHRGQHIHKKWAREIAAAITPVAAAQLPPVLPCKKCGADRAKEGCKSPNRIDCEFTGTTGEAKGRA